jgi:hypothetical protein
MAANNELETMADDNSESLDGGELSRACGFRGQIPQRFPNDFSTIRERLPNDHPRSPELVPPRKSVPHEPPFRPANRPAHESPTHIRSGGEVSLVFLDSFCCLRGFACRWVGDLICSTMPLVWPLDVDPVGRCRAIRPRESRSIAGQWDAVPSLW